VFLIVGLSPQGLGCKSAPSDHGKGGKLRLCTIVKKPDEKAKHGKTRHTASTPTLTSLVTRPFPTTRNIKGMFLHVNLIRQGSL